MQQLGSVHPMPLVVHAEGPRGQPEPEDRPPQFRDGTVVCISGVLHKCIDDTIEKGCGYGKAEMGLYGTGGHR